MNGVTKRKILTNEELSNSLNLNIVGSMFAGKGKYFLIIDIGIGFYRAQYTIGQKTQIKFEGKLRSDGKSGKVPFKEKPSFKIKKIK